ncbi:MAG: hypothetical protein K1X66_09250 [Verrucomicrobiae bacterium]|nr:hypothetical protein [Verrucomicrobiae bacterium]
MKATSFSFERFQKILWFLLVIFIALFIVGAVFNLRRFLIAYLFGFLFWSGVSLGCFGVLMLHHLVGGKWGFVIRRFLEAGLTLLPIFAILFLPILLGADHLYVWRNQSVVRQDPILRQQSLYLNPIGFDLRALLFFSVWVVMGWLLNKWSLDQDERKDPTPTRRLRVLSGPGIVLYAITVTFAFVDWVMSLEMHWYSSIFPALVIVGQMLSALTWSIVFILLFRRSFPFLQVLSAKHYHDLGNLLLALVLLWTYLTFSQLLIIYSGNLPHEIAWYRHRSQHGWQWIAGFLAVFHFAIPFFILLFRKAKCYPVSLLVIALGFIPVHAVAVYWYVLPSFYPQQIAWHWFDIVVWLGLGVVWLNFIFLRLRKNVWLPQNDPRFSWNFSTL